MKEYKYSQYLRDTDPQRLVELLLPQRKCCLVCNRRVCNRASCKAVIKKLKYKKAKAK